MDLEKLEDEINDYFENATKDDLKRDLDRIGIDYIDFENANFKDPSFEIPEDDYCYEKIGNMCRKIVLHFEGKGSIEDNNLASFLMFFDLIIDYQNIDKEYWQGIHFIDCFRLFLLIASNLNIPDSVGLINPMDLETTLKLAKKIRKAIMNYLNLGGYYDIGDLRLLYNFFVELENIILGDIDV